MAQAEGFANWAGGASAMVPIGFAAEFGHGSSAGARAPPFWPAAGARPPPNKRPAGRSGALSHTHTNARNDSSKRASEIRWKFALFSRQREQICPRGAALELINLEHARGGVRPSSSRGGRGGCPAAGVQICERCV